MDSSKKLSEMRKYWGAFANLGNVGAYDYFSQVVELNSIEESHLQACKNGAAPGRYKVLSTAVHEYTHWVDHVGTLWGQRHLLGLYDAMAARHSDTEHEFVRIPPAHDELLRIRSEGYYRTKGPAYGEPSPWGWTTSVGARFDLEGRPNEGDPICFISFNRPSKSGPARLVTRVPLTALALTECNALVAEFGWSIREVGRMGNAGTPASPEKTLERIFAWLYQSDMAEYSAAFHLTANLLKIGNLPETMVISSELARMALNTPAQLFGRLPVPYGDELPEEAVKRWRALFDRLDVGAAFFALTWAARDMGDRRPDELVPMLAEKVFGGLEAFLAAQVQEATALGEAARRDGHLRLIEAIAAGQRWLREAPLGRTDGLVCEALDGRGQLSLPGALLGDDHEWEPTKTRVHQTSVVEWVEEAYDRHSSIREFLVACGRMA